MQPSLRELKPVAFVVKTKLELIKTELTQQVPDIFIENLLNHANWNPALDYGENLTIRKHLGRF